MPLPKCKRVDAADTAACDALLAHGWREIEVLVTWRARGAAQPTPQNMVRQVMNIARVTGGEGRLFRDKAVARKTAIAKRVEWMRGLAEKAVKNEEVLRHVVWCAEGDGEIGAVLLFQFCKLVARVNFIAVHPKYQRRGGGRVLIEKLKAGCEWVYAGTQEHNEPAMAFYKALGFEIVKRERTFHR